MDKYDEIKRIMVKTPGFQTGSDILADLCREKDKEIERLNTLIADIRASWDSFSKKWEEVNGKRN